jgi:putative DNA primase/helicase
MDFDKAFSRKPSWDILSKASGNWPHLLVAIGGLHESQLSGSHQPCPSCRDGTDRYRWMADDGPGGWICTHCGGKNQQGGGGSGIDLLMRVRGWTFGEAVKRVELHYNGLPFQPAIKPATPLPMLPSAVRKHSELERFALLELAGQLVDGEGFSPTEAKQRTYSKRWAVYASANYDLACSVILQFETEYGIVEPPQEEPSHV